MINLAFLEDVFLPTDLVLEVPEKAQNIPFPNRYVTTTAVLGQALWSRTAHSLLGKAVHVPFRSQWDEFLAGLRKIPRKPYRGYLVLLKKNFDLKKRKCHNFSRCFTWVRIPGAWEHAAPGWVECIRQSLANRNTPNKYCLEWNMVWTFFWTLLLSKYSFHAKWLDFSLVGMIGCQTCI